MDVKPEEVLFIGDMDHDIQAGKKAGTKTAGILTGYHSRKKLEQEKPDFILENLSELKKLI